MQSCVLNEQLILSKTKQQSLVQITKLNLWGLNLTNIDSLILVPNLQILSLSINNIQSLKGLSQLTQLKELYLRKNQINDFEEISYLKNLQDLRILWLNENPIERDEYYRERIIKILPNLKKLDNKAVTAEEVQFAQTLLDQQISNSQQDKIQQIFSQEESKISKENIQKNAWINRDTPKTQKKESSLKKEFRMEIEEENDKQEQQQRQKEQKRSSNILTAIMLLVEELSPYDKEILRRELDKRYFSKRVLIPKKESLKPVKKFTTDQKIRKQSKILKEMLVSPEEIKQSETMNFYQVMKMVDTNFNNFFSGKKIDTKNYSQYLQVLLNQRKPQELQKAFEKMELYDIQPNLTCYLFLIESYGQSKELQKAEAALDIALEIYGWNVFLINSMIYSYRHLKNYERAINLFQQLKLKGIQPNEVTYTNLILLCKDIKQIDKCWELFEQAKLEKIEIDDFLMGVMIGICGETHDAEKAIKLWDEMIKTPEIKLNALHYSALIKALSSRISYCERAIEIYEEMKFKKIQPSKETFVYGLRAASKLGNVAVAYELALQLRTFDFKVDSRISTYLLQTYANAIKNPMLPANLSKKYFKDSWTIINNLIDSKKIKTGNLNALLDVHIQSNKLLEAEEIVLPLYDTLNLRRNSKTYQLFFSNLYEKRELQSIFNLYNKLNNIDSSLISRVSLDFVLKSYFEVKDINKIVELLDIFIQKKQQPNKKTLIELSKSKNIPDVILYRMQKFPFVLKRSLKPRRDYGEDIKLIHIEGKVRSKSRQRALEKQEVQENMGEITENVQNQMDKFFVEGIDNPALINDDDYENIEGENFSDYENSDDEMLDREYEYDQLNKYLNINQQIQIMYSN